MRATGAFASACRCAAAAVADKIISRDSDLVGACLYDAPATRNSSDFPHVAVAAELDAPDAQTILALEQLPSKIDAEADEAASEGAAAAAAPASGGGPEDSLTSLADALWLCASMFSGAVGAAGAAGRVGERRIFFFTGDWDAHTGPAEHAARERCLQRARDLADLGVRIVLFPLSPEAGIGAEDADGDGQGDGQGGGEQQSAGVCPGSALCCAMLVANGDADAAQGVAAAGARRDELRDAVRCREWRRRTAARVPLVLGTGKGAPTLAAEVYVLQRRATRGTAVLLDARTHTPLRTRTEWVTARSGARLAPARVRLAYDYAGEQVFFDRDEIDFIKCARDNGNGGGQDCQGGQGDKKDENDESRDGTRAGIHILGFKPLGRLKPYHNIRHAMFLRPDERRVRGSRAAFVALVDAMLDAGQFALARCTLRARTPPRLAALVPQRAVYSRADTADPATLVPSGLHLIPLPFADDLREVKLPIRECASSAEEMKEEQQDNGVPTGGEKEPTAQSDIGENDVALARRVVRRLRIDFSSRDFDNPVLQRHYAALQALALDRDTVEPVPDHLVPDAEGMARHADVVRAFAAAVLPPGYMCTTTTGTTARASKRAADGGGADGGTAAKRARTAAEVDWVDAVRRGAVRAATVALLREFLADHGVRVGPRDRKDQLVALVTQYVQDNILSKAAPPSSSSSAPPPPPPPPLPPPPPESPPVLPPCPYGAACYRKNPQHFREFSHPPS